jgi:hypothetical protein
MGSVVYMPSVLLDLALKKLRNCWARGRGKRDLLGVRVANM